MLLSGSLCHVTALGASATAIAGELGAIARLAQTASLHPAWLFSTPTVHQPSMKNFHRFMPPTRRETTAAALAHWLEDCSQVVARAADNARGGTLVIMTGYERLDVLADCMRSKLNAQDLPRLLVQRKTAGTSVLADEFLRMAKDGKRPIWLATGPAWTGLDLSDPDASDPENDLVLTDLIIPALPFGLERSSTQVARMRRMGFAAEIISTQRTMRQGMGRLVRREGLINRNIWLLDGRLINPAAASYTADLRRVLLPYLNRKAIQI